ncbi:MAG: sugar kinase, partial [Microbacterium sp.]
ATADGEAPSIAAWNPVTETIRPDDSLRELYDELFDRYTRLYRETADVVHELAAEQRGASA